MENKNSPLILGVILCGATLASGLGAAVQNSEWKGKIRSHGELQSPTPETLPRVNGAVSQYAALFDLKDLQNEAFDDEEYEIRVWYGFSNFSPRGFVISHKGNVKSATYFVRKLDSSNNLSTESKNYPQPNKEIEDEIVSSLLHFFTWKFVPDPGWGDPDATSVAVEIRKGKKYRIIKYQVDTTTPDGSKIINFVRRLESSYGFKLFAR